MTASETPQPRPDGGATDPGPGTPAESVATTVPERTAPADATTADEDAGASSVAQAAVADTAADTTVGPAPHSWLGRIASANPVTITVLAIFLALVVAAVLIVVSKPDVLASWGYFFAAPGDAISASWAVVSEAYANLFKGAIVDPAAVTGAINGDNSWTLVFAPISETLTYTAPLIFTGLAVALAFRAGLFNIGAQGQVIMGTIGAGLVGFELHLPAGLHLLLALAGGALGGALWGFIPGWLKARTGAHEVIVTIMLNYIAYYFLTWLIVQNGVQDPNRSDAISKKVDASARLPLLGGGSLRMHLGIVLGVLAAAGVAWLLNRSKAGFELRAVGANPDAARTAGMSVSKAYVLAMALAGGLAGLAGANMLLGPAAALTPQVAGNVGFDGITVALLGRGKPWGVVLAALFWGAFSAGGNRMQSVAEVPVDLVIVVQAIIVIFIAAPALVKAIFRLRADRSGRLVANLGKGW
jgi:ABC-type uncharacterized transport system permease subunit